MNKHAQAVKIGGDNWMVYLDEKLSLAHARTLIQIDQNRRDDYHMHMCVEYGRTWQLYTPGCPDHG